jgi:hypothetical protein
MVARSAEHHEEENRGERQTDENDGRNRDRPPLGLPPSSRIFPEDPLTIGALVRLPADFVTAVRTRAVAGNQFFGDAKGAHPKQRVKLRAGFDLGRRQTRTIRFHFRGER